MKIKKWLAALLILVQIFSCGTPIVAYANEYTEMKIRVCCNGHVEFKTILEDVNGRKYAPLSWLTYYGSLLMKENKGTYEYYYVGEEKLENYARRIFVNKKDNKFSIKLYRKELMLNPIEYFNWLKGLTKEEWEIVLKSGARNSAEAKDALGEGEGNWMELDAGRFTKKINYKNEIWVPMDQVLALCGVNVDVADGRLYIMQDLLSIWQVLYQYNMSDVAFDMDEEIWGHEGLSAAGYVVDTGLKFNVFRLDFVTNSGRIEDYKDIFKIYLSDNAAYLSMFEGGKSPISEREEMYRQYLQDVSSVMKLYGNIVEYEDAIKIIDVLGKNGVDVGNLDLGAEADKVGFVGDTINGLLWIYDYCNTYFNQVDDHREMLLTVYDYQIEKEPYLDKAKKMKEWPSYKAAQKITDQYNKAHIETEEVVMDGIMDLLKDKAPEGLAALFKSMKPWTITITVMEPFLHDEYETIADAAMLGYVENTMDMAYDTYTDCRYNGNRYTKEYDEESLNTMRLAGIMTLVISKYCYEYKNKQLHAEENDEKLELIQEMLVAYYMAADGLEMDAKGYYHEKFQTLQERLDYLTVILVEEDETEDTTKPDSDSRPNNNSNNNGNTDDSEEHVITVEEAQSCISCYNDSWYCEVSESEDGQSGTAYMNTTYEIGIRYNAPYEVRSATAVSATINGTPMDIYQTQDPEKIDRIYENCGIYELYGDDFKKGITLFLVNGEATNLTLKGLVDDLENFGVECEYIITVEVLFVNGQTVRVSYVSNFLSGWCGGPTYTEPSDY